MVLTHDYRSPAPEGAPVWDGKGLPHSFPAFCLETSRAELSGWNCAETLAVALGHGGLWPDGRPAAAFAVEPGPDLIRRVDSRCRASTLTLVRRATEAEVTTAVLDFSRRFGVHGERLAAEQWAWYVALGRPERDPERVEVSLRHALAARGMGSWTLRRFEAPPDVWAARSASVHTPDVWAAGLARDEWIGAEGGAAWHARFAWAAGDHRHRRAFARGLDARDAWMPLAALTVTVAALSRWVRYPPDFLTVGLREAYYAGLEIAVPTGKQELGWAVADQPEPR